MTQSFSEDEVGQVDSRHPHHESHRISRFGSQHLGPRTDRVCVPDLRHEIDQPSSRGIVTTLCDFLQVRKRQGETSFTFGCACGNRFIGIPPFFGLAMVDPGQLNPNPEVEVDCLRRTVVHQEGLGSRVATYLSHRREGRIYSGVMRTGQSGVNPHKSAPRRIRTQELDRICLNFDTEERESSEPLHGSAHSFPWTTWNLREPNGKLDLRGLMLAAFEL